MSTRQVYDGSQRAGWESEMRVAGLAAVAGVLVAGSASAMMPPQVYEEGRANAPYHLEVAIVAMTPGDDAIDTCRIEAEVVSIARDDSATLVPGSLLTFEVDCLRADADPNQIPDCVFFEQVEQLVVGTRLDVYLEDSGPGYAVVLGQVDVIGDEPPATDTGS
jgi:hypothetical protein